MDRIEMIVDPPNDPRDVNGWRECIAIVEHHRSGLDPTLYSALLASFCDGLTAAQAPEIVSVETTPRGGGIRGRLRAGRAAFIKSRPNLS